MRVLAHGDERIAENAEVRSRTLPLNRVSGVRVAGIKMRQQGGSQMSARRGTHDADTLRINLPIRRLRPHQAHCARRILKHGRMPVPMRAEPVFQDDAGHAMLVQPQRVIVSFMRRKIHIGAAWTNHHCRAGRIGGVGQIRRERGNVIARAAERAGRAVRPERDGRLHFRAKQEWKSSHGCNGEQGFH